MTKEELNSMKSDDLPFIPALNELYVKIYAVKKPDEQAKIRKTASGNYLWRVQSRIWDIKQNIEDIALTEQLIAGHDPRFSKLDKTVNAAKLIRYDYENFFLRMGKMRDLFLHLINEVMILNLKKASNMENKLLKVLSSTDPNFVKAWADIAKDLDELKPYRNHITHNGFIEITDLALVNAFYTFDMKFVNRLEEYRHEFVISDTQRELVEKFSAVIRSNLASIDQYLKLIYLFLYAPFIKNLDSMIKKK
jgi:hypothetical protein